METYFDDVITEVEKMLEDKKIEFSEIIQVLGPTMKLVEKISKPGIKGTEKRDFVIHVLKTAVERSNIDEDKKGIIITSCDTIIPPMIDTIIQASNGDFELNIAPIVTGCFSCFSSSISKKK